MEYFLDGFKNFANFSGRATRKQYWMFVLIYLIIYVVLSVIDAVLGIALLGPIFSLVMLIPSLSYAARRLHDTDRTGWWQLIALIPLVGAIILIVFLAQASKDSTRFDAPVSA